MIVETSVQEGSILSESYEERCAYCVAYLTNPDDMNSPIELVECGPFTSRAKALDKVIDLVKNDPVFAGSLLLVVPIRTVRR